MIWLLHGNLGEKDDFLPLLSLAKKDGGKHTQCQVLSLWDWAEELQQKSPEKAFPSLSDLSQKLAFFIEKQDKHPILCGYSLGGRIALHALKAHPTLWEKIVLVSTHWGLGSKEEKNARLALDKKWAHTLQEKGWETFYKAWNAQPVFQSSKDKKYPSALKNWGSPTSFSPSLSRQKLFALAFEHWSLGKQENMTAFCQENASLLPPISLLVGEADTKFLAHARDVKERLSCLPALALSICPNKGHRLLQEAPEALWSLLSPSLHSSCPHFCPASFS